MMLRSWWSSSRSSRITRNLGARLSVLAHPAVVDEPDRDGVQVVELLAATPLGGHQARFLELLQVLHHAEARHREPLRQCAQRLPVLAEELVEKAPPRRIGEGSEHRVHAPTIRDVMVTCQAMLTRPGRASRPPHPR